MGCIIKVQPISEVSWSGLLLDQYGGTTWKFCGGTSVQIGDVASLMVKDIGTHETAPSDIQIVK
jgi:hypothetical protein